MVYVVGQYLDLQARMVHCMSLASRGGHGACGSWIPMLFSVGWGIDGYVVGYDQDVDGYVVGQYRTGAWIGMFLVSIGVGHVVVSMGGTQHVIAQYEWAWMGMAWVTMIYMRVCHA